MTDPENRSTPPARAPRPAWAGEVDRRRTFAIISHPDAGKTTLTEKLLLYAGAIELAGAVRGRKSSRAVVSDWMEMERERGISVTSASMEIELDGHRLNLLDTPGHSDFSEDTYRTLFAADSVVMVIDAAKGVEPQTLKLFEACRLRRLPVLTFVNKLDQPGRDPFDLLHELEEVLHLQTVPFNWPIGSGDRFKGVFVPATGEVRVYAKQFGGAVQSDVEVLSLDDARLGATLGDEVAAELRETAELLTTAGTAFDRESYLAGGQSPVFFGSALSSFGLEPFLRAIIELAPPPRPRPAEGGLVDPYDANTSGFVFKVQANMNRKHRDRVAFLRVASGVLRRDDKMVNTRTGEAISVTRLYTFFGGARQIVEQAYPGDIVGLVNPGKLTIGDTLCADGAVRYPPIPRFAAEYFGAARLRDLKYKQFEDGIRQLEEEGLMQVVFPIYGRREPVLGAVGPLQLDLVAARLQHEYGVSCTVERLPYKLVRWLKGDAAKVEAVTLPSSGVVKATDRAGHAVLLFESDWHMDYCARQNPDVEFAGTT
ncbi:MAG: peptide chain release factor 3 [Vicinamibacterales bacterium]|nr:peptide chain release factor 3 [Vicinamibacterales bacterium]